MDDQLNNDLEHPQRLLKEVDIQEITFIEDEEQESADG